MAGWALLPAVRQSFVKLSHITGLAYCTCVGSLMQYRYMYPAVVAWKTGTAGLRALNATSVYLNLQWIHMGTSAQARGSSQLSSSHRAHPGSCRGGGRIIATLCGLAWPGGLSRPSHASSAQTPLSPPSLTPLGAHPPEAPLAPLLDEAEPLELAHHQRVLGLLQVGPLLGHDDAEQL